MTPFFVHAAPMWGPARWVIHSAYEVSGWAATACCLSKRSATTSMTTAMVSSMKIEPPAALSTSGMSGNVGSASEHVVARRVQYRTPATMPVFSLRVRAQSTPAKRSAMAGTTTVMGHLTRDFSTRVGRAAFCLPRHVTARMTTVMNASMKMRAAPRDISA